MSFTVRIGDRVRAISNRFRKRVTEDALRAVKAQLEEQAGEIVQRTQSGRDVRGRSFKPYTKAYRQFKENKGRTGEVDLTFTGTMLRAIQTDARIANNVIQGRIFFASAREAAKARGNQRSRRFFGLSEEQQNRLRETVRKALR